VKPLLLGKKKSKEVLHANAILSSGADGTTPVSSKKCEECESVIPQSRLDAVPTSRLCITCAQSYENTMTTRYNYGPR